MERVQLRFLGSPNSPLPLLNYINGNNQISASNLKTLSVICNKIKSIYVLVENEYVKLVIRIWDTSSIY